MARDSRPATPPRLQDGIIVSQPPWTLSTLMYFRTKTIKTNELSAPVTQQQTWAHFRSPLLKWNNGTFWDKRTLSAWLTNQERQYKTNVCFPEKLFKKTILHSCSILFQLKTIMKYSLKTAEITSVFMFTLIIFIFVTLCLKDSHIFHRVTELNFELY